MPDGQKPQILNQTLGELLQNNNEAQGVVMKAMQISPQQLQQFLNMTGNNQLMNMTIRDLFKNGVIQQATGQAIQVSPEQFQQTLNSLPQQNTQIRLPKGVEQPLTPEDKVPYTLTQASGKPSFLQKLKNLFR